MGLKNIFKSIKPSKDKLLLMQEQFDEGRILRVDDDVDNQQIMNEADYKKSMEDENVSE